jgi:hypothetical protein
MPYVLSFIKVVPITEPERYINDCCIGGDVVLDRLLPALRTQYGNDLLANQEDWGWFAWFSQSGINLAVDIHTNDQQLGEFQLHLIQAPTPSWREGPRHPRTGAAAEASRVPIGGMASRTTEGRAYR